MERLDCPIVSVEALNPFAFSMVLQAEEIARQAEPGQFLHVKCGEQHLLRRPISICDAAGGTVRLVFEVRGAGTDWLAQRRAGEALDVLGPLGKGFDLSGEALLLVGGGIGAPPLLYAARRLGKKARVALGFRDEGHAMLLGDFRAAAHSVAVASDDGSVGARGFAGGQAELLLSEMGACDRVLACGPRAMLRSVAELARRAGVPCQVSLEERMGCGVGACLVCACKTADGRYRHVCKDGPVFDAEEVDWDD